MSTKHLNEMVALLDGSDQISAEAITIASEELKKRTSDLLKKMAEEDDDVA